MKKKSNSKKALNAVQPNGLVQMRYLGNESLADWRVPGGGRSYRVGVANPLFYAQPDDADPLTRFVYKGRQLFEIVPLAPVEPEPEPIENTPPPEPAAPIPVDNPEPATEEELPFIDPPEPEPDEAANTTDEAEEGDDEEMDDKADNSLWETTDYKPKRTRRTSK